MESIPFFSLIILLIFEGKKTAENLVYKNNVSKMNLFCIVLIIVSINAMVYYGFY
jgi:hypothetical protein